MAKNSNASCQAEACDLQACLGKNTYSPDKCDPHVRALYQCCQRMYADNPKAESTACPAPSVVEKWLKDHPNKSSS